MLLLKEGAAAGIDWAMRKGCIAGCAIDHLLRKARR